MTQHPDLAAEQAYIDFAYECLERTRSDAWRLRNLTEADLGGTFQARFERNVFDETLVNRLTELELGSSALVFGRIDREPEDATAVDEVIKLYNMQGKGDTRGKRKAAPAADEE